MKFSFQDFVDLKNNFKFSKIKFYLDVGSFTTRVEVNNQLIFNQSTCFLLRKDDKEVLALGDSAMMVCGKEPIGTQVVFPIKQGVVYDQQQFDLFLSAVFKQLKKEIAWPWLARTEVIYSIPSSATELDQKIIKESLNKSGFSKITLVNKGLILLAQISGLDSEAVIKKSKYSSFLKDSTSSSQEFRGDNQIVVIDMGDEITEVVIGSGTMASFNKTIPLGGKVITNAICKNLKQEHNLLISFQQALKIKHNLQYQFADETNSAEKRFQTDQKNQINIRGIGTSSHMIETKTIRAEELIAVIEQELERLVYQVKQIFSQVKSEQLISALNNGVVLTGGASQLFGVDDYFAMQLQANVVKK